MTTTGFVSPEWLGKDGFILEEDGTQIPLHSTKLKGLVSLTCTPPWALHVTWSGASETQEKLKRALTRLHTSVVVVDLGPKALPGLEPPKGWVDVPRHTRQLALNEAFEGTLPKTRIKQARRFERESGTLEIHQNSNGWDDVFKLHLASRDRKGLHAHPKKLEALIKDISCTDWTFCVLARNAQGECIASGGFVILPDHTCIYAFGGQTRSQASGRASVSMLLEAMRHAQKQGCSVFDFGGSQDPGVDRFYAEFGSDVVFMRRWVCTPRWLRWIFPRVWRQWTAPSIHR